MTASAKSRRIGTAALFALETVLKKGDIGSFVGAYDGPIIVLPSAIQKCESCQKDFTAKRGLRRCQDCQKNLNAWLDDPKTPEKTALVGVAVDRRKTAK